MMILETYTTKPIASGEPELPDFLTIDREITTDTKFSMYQVKLDLSGILLITLVFS